MANLKKHIAVGASIGAGLLVLLNIIKQLNQKENDPAYQFNWGELVCKAVLGAAIGGIAGALPDLLEPATSPHHRKFFHSITTAGIISLSLSKCNGSNLSAEEKELINVAGTGYLSHLLLDSGTAMALPIL
jgi:membrane-bound metal-dependent hydrolase YbcI (DUF457 family)